MTPHEMAKEFVTTMNPENRTDGSANFAIYEFELNDKYNLELCFIEEHFDDDESCFRTAIDICDKHGASFDYTFAETMTDIDAIESGIAYLLEKWEVLA